MTSHLVQLSLLDPIPEPEPPAAPQAPPCHCCHVPGCGIPISLTMLMCIKHWLKVPKPLQREVWKHYRSGQEEDKQPSAEYLAAARAAIQSVLQPAPAPAEPPTVSPQVLEAAVIKPAFLLGDRVIIAKPLQGRSRQFIPWDGYVGTYCGTNPAGMALVDFEVPGHPYPVNPSFLTLWT